MHSFERKLSPLSNGVSGKVVQRIGRELFDLKARGDIFFESPCMTQVKLWCVLSNKCALVHNDCPDSNPMKW